MQISIIIDTYPMNPKNADLCWRIIDTDGRRCHAFGFKKTLLECFEEAHKNFLQIQERLKSPMKSSIWYAGCEFNNEN